MEFKIQIFQAWKVMELGLGPGKSWKINQMIATFLTHVHVSAFTYIIIVHCQTRFDLLFSVIMNCVTHSVLSEHLTCSISTRLSIPGKTWKMDKRLWKVLENAHKRSWIGALVMSTDMCYGAL